ncbi:Bug family tripartite tricarboxylate transporter substrate binding protein [Schauerella aestuarii]|uniref:Bug family tripartite tricarboxylate transporter substrate binding protein n=1 Tax=Schauerella aestuarii TaxID=2511204 RepID=UPI00136CC3A1|nr:tripartite tricarboxylate transporter substrate binding protein [Achromobacter aestuarii]MYZ45622.1 tripartite tricarboxylate transporter substrate binding protein [Achromobacter aestuarii]
MPQFVFTQRRRILSAAGAAMLTCALGAASAQAAEYPDRPLRMVIPYPPGGATDVVGRVLAAKLSDELKQQVVVENRGGAGGNLGADAVARAEPDGYTLLMGAITSHSIMATLEKPTISYKLMDDLTPVATVAAVPLVFVVNPNVPAKSLKELIAYAKANPGKLTYASSGAGAPQRMGAELFKRQAGVDMLHVPYRGSGPAMTDLVGGQVNTMVETVPAALPFIKSGQLRALAVTTPERISMLPDMPTAAEAGLPGFEVASMFGILVPAKTPAPIVEKLNAAVTRVLQMPDVKEKLLQQGAYAVAPASAPEARKRLQAEVDMWAKVIADAKITLE